MAESSLDQVAADRSLEIQWRAFELRPGGTAPEPRYIQMIEQRWPGVQEMGRVYGVEMRTHRFGVDTRLAHEGAKFVVDHLPSSARSYQHAIFEAYFYDDIDIGDREALVAVVAQKLPDIPVDAFQEALIQSTYQQAVLADEQFAFQAGIRGVPAFVVNEKYLLSGVRPPEQLLAELDFILQKQD